MALVNWCQFFFSFESFDVDRVMIQYALRILPPSIINNNVVLFFFRKKKEIKCVNYIFLSACMHMYDEEAKSPLITFFTSK